jgi:hypothetical protein
VLETTDDGRHNPLSVSLEETKMKNMTISLLALSVLAFGCKNKDCEDTAADCDSGATEGAEGEGEGETAQDSCTLIPGICVETAEADNATWCAGVGGTYDAAAGCDADGAVICDLPAGGDYSSDAVAYYSGDFDAETCTASGGTVRP